MSDLANHRVMVLPGDGDSVPGLDMLHKVRKGGHGLGPADHGGIDRPGTHDSFHTHSREDECSYILAGELMFEVGDQTVQAGPGSYVLKPRGVPHAFWNLGSEPARVMEIHVPDFFDQFYDELGAILGGTVSQPDRQAAQAALHAKYGLVLNWDRTAELAARYGLSP